MKRFYDLKEHPPQAALIVRYTEDSGLEPLVQVHHGTRAIWEAINTARALWLHREAERVRALCLSRTEPEIARLFEPVRSGTDTLPYCPSCGDGQPCADPGAHVDQVMEKVWDVLAAP